MVGMTANTYMLFFYNGTNTVDQYYGYGQLNTALATVDATGAVTVADPVVLTDSAVVYNMAATRLSATTAVVTYADASKNYAILCQAVEIVTETTQTTLGKYLAMQ